MGTKTAQICFIKSTNLPQYDKQKAKVTPAESEYFCKCSHPYDNWLSRILDKFRDAFQYFILGEWTNLNRLRNWQSFDKHTYTHISDDLNKYNDRNMNTCVFIFKYLAEELTWNVCS